MVRKQSRILNTVPTTKADDFRLIKGIGPVLAGRLYDAGVCTYKQLALLSPAKLAEMVTGVSVKQISRQDWSGEARKLAKKKHRPNLPKRIVLSDPLASTMKISQLNSLWTKNMRFAERASHISKVETLIHGPAGKRRH